MGRPGRLAKEHRRALARLSRVPGIEHFYLVGGTAIGYHLGHRISRDIAVSLLNSSSDYF